MRQLAGRRKLACPTGARDRRFLLTSVIELPGHGEIRQFQSPRFLAQFSSRKFPSDGRRWTITAPVSLFFPVAPAHGGAMRWTWGIACPDATTPLLRACHPTARKDWSFDLWAYVLMPEHVHLLIYPRGPKPEAGKIAGRIKEAVARRAIAYVEAHAPERLPRITVPEGARTGRRFWQSGGGYDRNVAEPSTAHPTKRA